MLQIHISLDNMEFTVYDGSIVTMGLQYSTQTIVLTAGLLVRLNDANLQE